ncbi:MAG: SIR2 family protein [Hyphomonadaceae bacterium]|nr:SIR2 family protein [Hyphomonadaceae bacterium]
MRDHRESARRDLMQRDRLQRKALDALSSVFSARRRLLAFTGSGLSLIYGGMSWDEAVLAIVEDTLRRLADRLDDRSWAVSPSERAALKRYEGMIEVYAPQFAAAGKRPSRHESSAADRMVVLELCEDARAYLRKSSPDVESANALFARLVKDDSIATNMRLADRLSGYAAAGRGPAKRWSIRRRALQRTAVKRDLEAHSDELAAVFYSQSTFRRVAEALNHGSREALGVLEALQCELAKAGYDRNSAFPIDRRSTFAPFMGLLPRKGRKAVAKYVRDALEQKQSVEQIPIRPLTDPLKKVADELMVRRFMTVNYDWELERLLLYPDKMAQTARHYTADLGVGEGLLERHPDEPGGALSRRMPDGRYVASEVYAVHASARLFDFALNSADHSAYVLHLHGRADAPDQMVAREPDYHRTYRRDSGNPRALERALDVALTGNPILVLGLGMGEIELTRTFKQLVAEGRVTPDRPAFILSACTSEDETQAWRQEAAFFQQFGVYVLHYGQASCPGGASLSRHVSFLRQARARARAFRKSAPLEAEPHLLDTVDALHLVEGMAADRKVLRFIVRILQGDGESIAARLRDFGIEQSDKRRVAAAMRGFEDYLERLESRIQSEALSVELSRLANYISATVTHGDELPKTRESIPWQPERLTPLLYTRHVRFEPTHHDVAYSGATEDADRTTTTPLDAAISDAAPPGASTPVRPDPNLSALQALQDGRRSAMAIGAAHAGKGSLVRRLIGSQSSPMLVINFTFAVEVDGAIALIFQFLKKIGAITVDDELNKVTWIEEALCKPASGAGGALGRILLTGLERLMDKNGGCLSPDIEVLLRAVAQAPEYPLVSVVLMGTETLALWRACEEPSWARPMTPQFVPVSSTAWPSGVALAFADVIERMKGDSGAWTGGMRYLTQIADRQETSSEKARHMAEAIIGHWGRWVRYVYSFENGKFPAPGAEAAFVALDMAVVRFLSVVTAPIERGVLRHVPDIAEALTAICAQRGLSTTQELIKAYDNLVDESLSRLRGANIVVELNAVLGEDRREVRNARYALHRVVLEMMRDRMGVSVGDTLLSNTFTLTLAASLPVDVAIPDRDVRQNMERTLAHLRGAWKDSPSLKTGEVAQALKTLRKAAIPDDESPHTEANRPKYEVWRRLERMTATTDVAMSASLRASCNLLRSFFNATALVTLTADEADTGGYDRIPFELHKRRIRKLLSRLRQLQAIGGEESRAEQPPHGLPETISGLADHLASQLGAPTREVEEAVATLKKREKVYAQSVAPPPLYGGEIVWLHNERGVISLIQGDLYEAAYSFDLAISANTAFKGAGRGNNRNRIDLNKSMLLIERGRLSEARSLLHVLAADVKHRVSREQKRLTPIIEGYLGLVAHLNGRSDDALRHYALSLSGLIDTEQLRALSLFQMRRASLLASTRRSEEARLDIDESIRSAEACRQTDVLWRARLLRSAIDPQSRDRDHVGQQAFLAAESLGLVRVSVEALMARAEAALRTGNTNFAADLTAQAMARASRSGMTLRRISLRVLMGRIMIRQGDENGVWLIRRAIALADRIGYQSCVQSANETLLKRDLVAGS